MFLAPSRFKIGHTGTAQAGSANTLTLAIGASAANGEYIGDICNLPTGPGSVQERPVSAYDGGTKVATVSPAWGPKYLSLPGTTGNYASTPDSAAVSVTGDIDIRAKLAPDDWTPVATGRIITKRKSGQFSFDWGLNTDGVLAMFTSADGVNQAIGATSSVAVGAVDGSTKWVRVTVDVDNGASGSDTKFWTSDDGETWAQLGSTVTTAGTTSLFDGTAAVWVGNLELVDRLFAGKVFYAEVRNGIDGPVVAKFDPFNDANGQATSFTSDTGEVWTINQSGGTPAVLTGFPDATTGYEVEVGA